MTFQPMDRREFKAVAAGDLVVLGTKPRPESLLTVGRTYTVEGVYPRGFFITNDRGRRTALTYGFFYSPAESNPDSY